MTRLKLGFHVVLVLIALELILPHVVSSWTTDSDEQICDVDADFALGLEDYPAAIRQHREVLRAHNENALAHYHLGFAYGMTGRASDEINEYLAAKRLGLKKWDLFVNLGIAYGARNDWSKAIDALRAAVSLGPDHPETHFNLAIAYGKLNLPDKALQEIRISEKLAPLGFDQVNQGLSGSVDSLTMRELQSSHATAVDRQSP